MSDIELQKSKKEVTVDFRDEIVNKLVETIDRLNFEKHPSIPNLIGCWSNPWKDILIRDFFKVLEICEQYGSVDRDAGMLSWYRDGTISSRTEFDVELKKDVERFIILQKRIGVSFQVYFKGPETWELKKPDTGRKNETKSDKCIYLLKNEKNNCLHKKNNIEMCRYFYCPEKKFEFMELMC